MHDSTRAPDDCARLLLVSINRQVIRMYPSRKRFSFFRRVGRRSLVPTVEHSTGSEQITHPTVRIS